MPDTWDDLRERYALAAADFLALAGRVDPARAAAPGVCGGWSAKDVVAHLAAWEWEAERRFRELRAGNAQQQTYDIDAFNAAAVAERQDRPWDDVLDELRRANMTFGGALGGVSGAERAQQPGYTRWVTIAAQHYAGHAAELRAWLDATPAS